MDDRSVTIFNGTSVLESFLSTPGWVGSFAASFSDAAVAAASAVSASCLARAAASSSFFLLSATLCLASRARDSLIDLLYASLIVSRRWAKSMGPTEILRGLLTLSSSCLDGALDGPLDRGRDGDRARSTVLILELAVVADATDCLGRELRREGESFG